MLKGCRCHGRVVKQFHHSLETSFKRWSGECSIINGVPASVTTGNIFNVFYCFVQNHSWTSFIWTNLILNSSIWSVFEWIHMRTPWLVKFKWHIFLMNSLTIIWQSKIPLQAFLYSEFYLLEQNVVYT
jgi:hypothetical protein